MAARKQNRATAYLQGLGRRATIFAASRGVELLGLAVLAATTAAALALVSHNAMDPSWNRATDATPQNWLGLGGAVFSDQAYQFFGLGAWATLPALAAYGWRRLHHKALSLAYLRVLAWVAGIICSSLGAALLFPPAPGGLADNAQLLVAPVAGGLIGQMLLQWLV